MTQSSAHLETEKTVQRFSDLDISLPLKKGVKELGYVTPTAFQIGVFENFHHGKNIVGDGESSYGKSLAFCLPILSKIVLEDKNPQALIISENALSSEITAKECRALGRHLDILVASSLPSEKAGECTANLLVLPIDELAKASLKDWASSLKTVFFDGLSGKNAELAIELMAKTMSPDAQILIFGKDTINAFKKSATDLIETAVFISNNDQPKITAPAKHIFHQSKDAEPKVRALLAALELHKPKSALITCNEASECELLSRYLARYGYKTTVVSEENNRHGIQDALRECVNGSIDALICQGSLLMGQGLENVAFMINYDMFDRPQAYEQTTQFNKQAPGTTRTIVNILTNRELGCLGPIKAQCLIDFCEMPLPSDDEVMNLCAGRIVEALNKEASDVELGQFEMLAEKIVQDPKAGPALSLLLRNHLLKSKVAPNTEGREPNERRSSRPMMDRRRPERPERPERRERDTGGQPRGDAEEGPNEESFNRPNAAQEGITRLYITLGRRDGFSDLASLAQYLSEKSGVDLGHFSGSGMIRDNSAHIEVDDDVVETIIQALNNSDRPNAEKEEGAEPNLVVCEKARASLQRTNRRPQHHHRGGRRPNFSRRPDNR